MAYAPIQLFSTPQEDYAAYWLKFYEQGTVTPLSMATDSTGGTLIVKAEISSGGTVPIGFIKTAGDALLNPFINGAYDAWLFPTSAEADANDTTNAIQLADNLNADPLSNETIPVVSEWVTGTTPTFVSATSFTLVGDQTTEYHVGRRTKTTNTAGPIYSTIVTSVYTSLTTITVVNDSGVLDSGLSAVVYGIISADNTSSPAGTKYGSITFNDDITFNDTVALNGVTTASELVNLAAGANIASAATIDLTSSTGNSPRITGTTATSAVTMNTGQQMLVVADGVWPLTYHATTNKLNGGVSYTCAAGDMVLYNKDLSGVVHGFIMKASGEAIFSVSGIESFASSGTFTATHTGFHTIVISGGGGSGGNGTTAGSLGGLGGSKGKSRTLIQSLTEGVGYTVTIGAGGAVPVGEGAGGNSGGPTVFDATAMSGGIGGLGGASASSTGGEGEDIDTLGQGGSGATAGNGLTGVGYSSGGGGGGASGTWYTGGAGADGFVSVQW